jgi:predicted PurR-regulated permease PerM
MTNAPQRAIAGLAGMLMLGVFATFTAGLALAAPIGMLGAGAVARHQRVPLTRGASWLGAAIAVLATLLLLFGAFALLSPPGTFANFRQSYDSVSAASRNTPPPAWIERFAPGASRARSNAVTVGMQNSPAFTLWAAVVGGVLGCSMVAAFVGTLGWAAGLLLAYAMYGSWIGVGMVADDPESIAGSR